MRLPLFFTPRHHRGRTGSVSNWKCAVLADLRGLVSPSRPTADSCSRQSGNVIAAAAGRLTAAPLISVRRRVPPLGVTTNVAVAATRLPEGHLETAQAKSVVADRQQTRAFLRASL